MPIAQIPRIVYFAQSGTVLPTYTGAGYTGTLYTLPVSSANMEVQRPIEGVNTFGHFGSLNTAQTNLATCKSTLKGYLGSGSGINGINAAFLNDIINNTESGNAIQIQVGPGGFTMSGILDNLGIDIALGGFAMADLGFAGVGEPVLTNPLTAGSSVSALNTSFSIAPITTMSIGAGPNGTGALSGVYATSIKFSYSLPTDILGALGDYPDATQGALFASGPSSGQPMIISQMATKPPYKSTISVEGHGVNAVLTDAVVANATYVIGNIGIQLPHAKVSARSTSNAAGQVSETFSYTIEDFSAVITDTSALLAQYGQPPASLPAYGG